MSALPFGGRLRLGRRGSAPQPQFYAGLGLLEAVAFQVL